MKDQGEERRGKRELTIGGFVGMMEGDLDRVLVFHVEIDCKKRAEGERRGMKRSVLRLWPLFRSFCSWWMERRRGGETNRARSQRIACRANADGVEGR